MPSQHSNSPAVVELGIGNKLSRREVLQRGVTTGVLVIGGATVVATQSASGKEKPEFFSFPLTAESPTDCNGTTITFTRGTFEAVVHEFEDSNGGFHLIVEGSIRRGLAEDDDGNVYTVTGTERQEFNGKGDNETVTYVATFNALGRGSAGKFKVRIVSHVTTVDGDLIVDFTLVDADCD